MKPKIVRNAECHADRIHYAKGMCKTCYFNKYVDDHPEFKQRLREYARKWRKNGPVERGYRYKLKWKYGLTQEQYDNMVKEQGGKCAICLNPPKQRVLCVDHCHSTGRVRALLCQNCNSYFGKVEHDPELLTRLLQYYERFRLDKAV